MRVEGKPCRRDPWWTSHQSRLHRPDLGFRVQDTGVRFHPPEVEGCRVNMAYIRQSRPDSGLGFQVEFLETLHGVPSSLGSGPAR